MKGSSFQLKPQLVTFDNNNVKRFAAKDLRSAMLQAQTELGVDAAIISSREGAYGVEISVICDPHLPYLAANENLNLKPKLDYQRQINQLQQQIKDLQKLLSVNFALKNKTQDAISAHLFDLGLSSEVIEDLTKKAAIKPNLTLRKKWQQMLLTLVQSVQISGLNPNQSLFLVGPSFVDLLQSTKEIAAYYLANAGIRPSIIALNCRANEWLQLNMLGQKMQIAVKKELTNLTQMGQIVVAPHKNQQLLPNIKPVLVLPAIWQEANLVQSVQDFACSNVIFSQFNLSCNLGSILNLLLQHNLTLAAICTPYLKIPKSYQLVSQVIASKNHGVNK